MTSQDVVEIGVAVGQAGEHGLVVHLTDGAAQKLEAITKESLGEEVAISIGEEVVGIERVNTPVGAQFFVWGGWDLEQARTAAARVCSGG